MKRRCLWPGCYLYLRTGSGAQVMYCFAHYAALGPELQQRLRESFGTPEWLVALEAAQAHARETNRWVKNDVTGGSTC